LRPPFGIEIGVRLQPKRAFDVVRNGRSTSPKYAATALRYLLGCSPLLVAYDVDVEDDKGAKGWPSGLCACSEFGRPRAKT
jgi:hypothetical protein